MYKLLIRNVNSGIFKEITRAGYYNVGEIIRPIETEETYPDYESNKHIVLRCDEIIKD